MNSSMHLCQLSKTPAAVPLGDATCRFEAVSLEPPTPMLRVWVEAPHLDGDIGNECTAYVGIIIAAITGDHRRCL